MSIQSTWVSFYTRFEQSQSTVIWLFLGFFVVRFALFLLSDEGAGDAIVRVYMAKNIKDHQMWITAGVWLPLHFYLMAVALFIYNDPLFSPRLVSLLCGTLVVIPYYYLIKNEFNSRTAILSILFLLFYILHVFHSMVSYAESLSVFLVVSALYFFFSYIRDPDRHLNRIVGASAVLAMACMVRGEGWPLLGLLTLILCWFEYSQGVVRALKRVVVFITLPLLCISLWFLSNYIVLGDPFYTFNWAPKLWPELINAPFYTSMDTARLLIPKALMWINVSFWTIGPFLFLFAIFGMAKAIVNRTHILYLLMPMCLWIVLTTQTLLGKLPVQPRYSLHYGVLLIPFGALGLLSLIQKTKWSIRPYFGIGLLMLTLFVTAGTYYFGRQIKPPISNIYYGLWNVRFRSVLPEDMEKVSAWLKKNRKENEKILIDYAPYSCNIALTADIDDLTHFNGSTIDFNHDIDALYSASPALSYKPEEYASTEDTRQQLTHYISTYKPRYLLYHTQSGFKNIFQFPQDCESQSWHQFSLRCRYESGGYHIYEISYL